MMVPIPKMILMTYGFEPFEDNEETQDTVPEADPVDAARKPILKQSFDNSLINAEVLLPHGEGGALTKVVRQAVDGGGEMIGNYHFTQLLNTLVYKCEFDDGTVKEYGANIITQNISNK